MEDQSSQSAAERRIWLRKRDRLDTHGVGITRGKVLLSFSDPDPDRNFVGLSSFALFPQYRVIELS